jgi:hypothetical protein
VKTVVASDTYDTDLATEVASRDNGRADARWSRETLYERTGDGALFVHATGGPLSRYSGLRDGVAFGREVIQPLSAPEARRWLRSVSDRDGRRTDAPRKGAIVLVGDR